MKLLSLSVALACVAAVGSIRRQSYAVTGRLVCGDEDSPAAGVKVKLYDEDDFGFDDDLQEGVTDEDGRFSLSGSTREWTPIDPRLKVYHQCLMKAWRDTLANAADCSREWIFRLSTSYTSSGRTAKRTLDIGTWNLEMRQDSESHECT